MTSLTTCVFTPKLTQLGTQTFGGKKKSRAALQPFSRKLQHTNSANLTYALGENIKQNTALGLVLVCVADHSLAQEGI